MCNKTSRIENLIRTDHLNIEEKEAITSLCHEFSDIFHKDDDKLTFTNQIKHQIKTSDEIPIHTRSYRYPFVHKLEVKNQIDKMLKDGIIRPSQSPWSSPIWVVPKKIDASGKQKWRIVIDYRKVNEKTVDDRYPLPNITDILDKLGKCQYFTTLDLASGFHQIEMDPNSISKTAFNVENGHYEFVRMPFGLKNAPATFQRVMDNVLKELQEKICFVYMDDIIVFSTSLQEHISNLKLIFKRLRECRLKVQLDKSEFLRKEVEFLGHIVTPEGIKPNPKKIEAIQRFPIPKTAKDIKSFLGLLGYYRRFIKNFARITKPFTTCLKKGAKIEHTDEFCRTFQFCKDILCNDPILQYPDFKKPFILTTDASNFAIGAILSQGNIGTDLPVAYASRTLNPAECNYSTIEKELLAVVWATKYFRPYLFGRKFVIVTDHKPLQWLFNLKEPNSRLVRWRLKLEEFDYKIIYKKGKQNTNADALSRTEINAIENDDTSSVIANVGDTTQMIDEYLKNEHLTPVSENPSYMDSPIPPPDHLRNDDITSNISKPTPSTTLSNSVTHGSKINIISNIQIKPPDKNPSDNETVHSALENPVITIPITDKPLNHYKNQVILFCSRNILKPNVQQTTIFNKNRLTISLPTNNIESHIINVIKEYVDSKQNYTLYFKTLELADIFNNVIQSYFKNSSFKFIKSTILLQDIVNSDQQTEKLIYHHQGKTCHKGINEMKTSIERNFYWPDLIKDITNFVNNCVTCQVSKYERNPPVLKFNLTPTASKPLEHIHIDTFKISNNSFLTILDAFSRYGQAYHIASLSPINIIDSLLVFISHHGLPNKITADRGGEFKNNSLENFCELHKIELHFTTSKNSNSNSPVERFHSTLAEEIRCLKIDKPHENITSLMNYAIIGYNNAIHSVTGHTPFEVLKGHLESTHPFDLTDGKIISNYIQNHKEKTNIIYNQIKEKLNNNKEILISKLNENRETPKEFKTNDPAYITTKERNKAKPKFIKTNVLSDQNDKLVTHRGTYHKSATKNPRKIHQKALFQRTIQHDLPNNNPNNIGEPTNDERH
jgi:hypothetical protein